MTDTKSEENHAFTTPFRHIGPINMDSQRLQKIGSTAYGSDGLHILGFPVNLGKTDGSCGLAFSYTSFVQAECGSFKRLST
jgi:hypothetical protein